jgi:asparagine synthase (glutamine-hydrolysing)
MCGIAGVLTADSSAAPSEALVRSMLGVLRHRGPDDEGVWVDGQVGLGSRRLAVIDLSPRAHQPMASDDGRLRLVFNGEIYNFKTLRAELEQRGHAFRSASDTEVLLHLYQEHGVDCLARLRGMFAFALWDESRRTLLLARDRLGKKPLFYRDGGPRFLFASEPKALLADPRVEAEPDLEALDHYLTYGYVPGPWSAFKGVRKLPPAHYLLVRDGRAELSRYWSLRYTPKRSAPEDLLAEELAALLQEAVRLRLESDVPLGALLSGGLDSSLVVALMRRLRPGRLRTFSIGFEDPEYDELPFARQVAERFDTEHSELVVKPDVATVLPRLVWHYGEPFADSSALPAFLLCAMARQSVTVALGGDGGDEAFVGYDRYLGTVLAEWSDRVPGVIRQAAARGARLLGTPSPRSRASRVQRFAGALCLDPRRRYGRWMTLFDAAQKDELCSAEFRGAGDDSMALLDAAYSASDAPTFLEATVHTDVRLYLPDDLLVKTDLASMAHSLEVRSPLLDHTVMEFAASLPPSLKLRWFRGKYLIRKLMTGVLPDAVLRRKKMGFGVPIDGWLRVELREMVHDILLDARARARGYFHPEVVRRYLDEHAAGRGSHHQRLWALLMLELWHRTFIDGRDRSAPAAS